jgi:hypothetical protein
MSSSRPIVRAFGSSASGAGTAVVAIPAESTAASGPEYPQMPWLTTCRVRFRGMRTVTPPSTVLSCAGAIEGEVTGLVSETTVAWQRGPDTVGPAGPPSEYASRVRRDARRPVTRRRSASSTTSASRKRTPLPDGQRRPWHRACAFYLRVHRDAAAINPLPPGLVAEYLRGLEELREAGGRLGSRCCPPPVRAPVPATGYTEELWAVRRGARLVPLHVHADELAARDRGASLPSTVSARSELPAARRWARAGDDDRACDARGRQRARPLGEAGARFARASRRRRTSRTASSRSSGSPPSHRPVHRLRFERPHRPARGTARADGIARRQAGQRDVFSAETSWRSAHARRSCAPESRSGRDRDRRRASAAQRVDEPLHALVHGCSADVVVRSS